ncbi:MAG: YceI family protein [Leeuwenhoekiella sp.]
MEKVTIKSSTIKWTGKKVLGKHHGTIDLKEGYFEKEGDTIIGGHFIMDMPTIKVTDLDGEEKQNLEGHLKNDDFFGVEKYPTATLNMSEVSRTDKGYSMIGDLTIKDHTEPLAFELDVNNDTAKTLLVIDRSKFNVRYGSGKFFDNLGDQAIRDNFELDITMTM